MHPKGKALNQARPRLFMVAPLTTLICWGYAITNIFLGLGLIFTYKTPVGIAVANILTYSEWGMLFFLVALIGVYSLIRNDWNMVRNALAMGLGLKSIWCIALIFRCFTAPATLVITTIWFFFTFIQAITYIYFLPVSEGGNGRGPR